MAEVRTTSSTGGQKGTKLARFDLIPVGPLTELAEHYGRGAAKYASHQWRQGYEWSKSYAALMRHLVAFWAGQDYDVCSNEPDNCVPWSDGAEHEQDTCFNHTGSHHMAAVAWHAFLLLEFKDAHPGHDDRYREPATLQAAADGAVTLAQGGLIQRVAEEVKQEAVRIAEAEPEIQAPPLEDQAVRWVKDYDAEMSQVRLRNFPRVETGLPSLSDAMFPRLVGVEQIQEMINADILRMTRAADQAVEDRLRQQWGPDLLSKRRPIKDTPQA